MIKKTVGGILLLMLVGFLFGREARSYLRVSVSQMRQAIKSELPIEFEWGTGEKRSRKSCRIFANACM